MEISDKVINLNSEGKYAESKELAFGLGLQQYNSLVQATDEFALGVTDLSTNAQNGVEKLENLSKQIGSLSNNSKIIYVAII